MTTLSDDALIATVNDEEVEPLCKKPRLQDQITHFVHLKLHTRLIIYDFFGIEFMQYTDPDLLVHLDLDNVVEELTGYEMCSDLIELSHSYARMTVVASILGDLHTLQYLAGIPCNIFIPKNYKDLRDYESFNLEDICYLLALNGHWNALQWAISENYPHKYYTLMGAVEGGANIDMLQLLSSQGCEGNEYAFEMAAQRGDWTIMKWLHEIRCPWDSRTFSAAVCKCELDVLRWLKTNKCPWNADAFKVAVDRGDFKVLVWLRVEGCPWDSYTFNFAISHSADLATLQWFLHEDISLMDDSTFNFAIKRGDMDILKLLRMKNCKMTRSNFLYAIAHKVPIEVLEWMYDAKCPWNVRVFSSAIKRGNMDILMWLREKKCPWNSDCYKIALEKERLDIVQWLHEEECPYDDETFQLVMQALIKLYEQQKAA